MLVGVLTLLAGCREEDPFFMAETAVPARFVPSIGSLEIAQTRVVNDTWSPSDIVGIAGVETGKNLSSSTVFRTYKPDKAGTLVTLEPTAANQTIYFPIDGSDVDFYAFAPVGSYSSNSDNAADYGATDQSTLTKLEAVDFIWAKTTKCNKKNANVSMDFEHKKSKVVVVLTPGIGITGNEFATATTAATLSIKDIPYKTTYTLSNGISLGNGYIDVGSIAPFKETSTQKDSIVWQAIVPPHKGEDYTDRTFAFKFDGKDYTYKLPDDEYEAGKSYTYNLTLTSSGLSCPGSTVADWGAGTISWSNGFYLTLSEHTVDLYKDDSSTKYLMIETNHDDTPEVYRSKNANDVTDDAATVGWLAVGAASGSSGSYKFGYFATPNNTGTPRTAYIHVKVGTELTAVVKVTQGTVGEPVTVLDGESNCFIVAPGTKISFPVTRPVKAGTANYGADYTVGIVWDDTQGKAVQNYTTFGKIGTDNITVTAGPNPGNTLLAVYVNATIVWSYHIWVTDYNPNAGATYTNAYKYNNTNYKFTFMDRNLGATFAGTGGGYGTGLFYQWGRKDPFPATGDPGVKQMGSGQFTVVATDATIGTIEGAIKNPGTFIKLSTSAPYRDWLYNSGNRNRWGQTSKTKTIYDPCPSGWRVPIGDTNPWFGFTVNNGGNWSNGWSWNTNASYPTNGYRCAGSGIQFNFGTNGYYHTATSQNSYAQILSLSSTLVGITDAYPDDAFSVRCVKDEPYAIPETPANLLDGETNCFVVAPDETIYFPVTRPITAGTAASGTAFTTWIVWDDTATKSVVSYSPNGHIGEIISVTAGPTKGNALLAVKVGSTVVWSYHIWVTDDPTVTTYTNNGYRFMDRHLGATSTTPGDPNALGMHYQWGRKDPFPGSSSISADIERTLYSSSPLPDSFIIQDYATDVGTIGGVPMATAIANPWKFYSTSVVADWCSDTNIDQWGYYSQVKGLQDPCPTGWHVPDAEAFNGIEINHSALFPWDPIMRGRFSSSLGWFPASGIREWFWDFKGKLAYTTQAGCLWSRNWDKNGYWDLHYNEIEPWLVQSITNKGVGMSVRCVSDK